MVLSCKTSQACCLTACAHACVSLIIMLSRRNKGAPRGQRNTQCCPCRCIWSTLQSWSNMQCQPDDRWRARDAGDTKVHGEPTRVLHHSSGDPLSCTTMTTQQVLSGTANYKACTQSNKCAGLVMRNVIHELHNQPAIQLQSRSSHTQALWQPRARWKFQHAHSKPCAFQ
jgi:hypothetical protein